MSIRLVHICVFHVNKYVVHYPCFVSFSSLCV